MKIHEPIVISSEPFHYGSHQKKVITEEANIMTRTTNDLNEPLKLSDDELAEVSDGSGSWAGYMEDSLRHAHRVQLDNGLTEIQDYRTWLSNAHGVNEDVIKARDA